MRASPVLLVPLLTLAGCGGGPGGGGDATCGDGEVTGGEVCDDGVNDALGGGCLPGCAARDDSDALFARELVRVDLELPAADWELLRHEHKSRHSTFGAVDCRSTPIDNPYAWYPATVTIDGARLVEVGLRKKGHLGSQSTLKPSLKLDLDRFVDGQALHGLGRLALNNSRSDPSFARTCLSYRVFAAAGVPAPRCTLAAVTLNGADLGVFVAVEEISRPFLARHFADPGGTLYEGTANDFRAAFVGGFEQETNEDRDADRDELAALVEVVEGAGDDALVAALEPLVDLPAFYRFWAAESLLWHRDGYAGNANNFFVYADPAAGGRLRFLPWGPDSALRADNRDTVPDSVLAFGALANRLYAVPAGRDAYHAELAAQLDAAWRPDELAAELARIGALVEPRLAGPAAVDQAASAAELADVLATRRAVIEGVLAGGPPPWTAGLRELPCRTPLGPVSGSFTTTWDTLGTNVFAAGSGALTLALDGAPVESDRVGARAGLTAGGEGRLQLSVDLVDGRRLGFTADFPDERWFDPFTVVGEHLLVTPPLAMSMSEVEQTAPTVALRRFDVGEGTWTFEAIETVAGAEVRGRFAGTLYLVP